MVAIIRNKNVYVTEFEKIVFSEVERQVNGLPPGVADCYIGPSQHDSRMIAPTFRIRPTNPDAAPISGAVLEGEGVVISVGHSRREIGFRGTSTADALECAQRVSEICRAVFAGNFTERLEVDRTGRRISSSLRLPLSGGDFRMWQNRILTDLFRLTTKREIHYAPYV